MKRFDIYRVTLDPTVGSEIKKTRPCVIISPDEINDNLATVIISPMTTKGRLYPSRVECLFQKREGQIVLDQIRTVDKRRLIQFLGRIDSEAQKQILSILNRMFSE